MAVTLTSNLTTLDGAESTTNWAAYGAGGGSVSNDVDFFIKGSGANNNKTTAPMGGGFQVGGMTWDNALSRDITNEVIVIWMHTILSVDTKANGGIRMVVIDGSGNEGYWYVGGSDTYAGGWRAFCAHGSTAFDGNNGTDPTLTDIDKIGMAVNTNSIISGNVKSLWVDEIAIYADTTYALTVSGGTTGDRGTWAEVAAADLAAGYGIVQTIGDAILLQGHIRFGDTGTASTYFDDSDGAVIVWHDQPVDETRGSCTHRISVVANSTGTNVFSMGTKTGSGSSSVGSDGATISSANQMWEIEALSANQDEFKLYGCSFKGVGGDYLFGDGTNTLGGTGDTCEIVDCAFNGMDQVVRDVSAATSLEKGNQILFAADTRASLDVRDSGAADAAEWEIIEGPGFEDSQGNTTIRFENHSFRNTAANKPFFSVSASSGEFLTMVNADDGAGGRPSITDQTEFAFDGTTTGAVNEELHVNFTVSDASASALQNARCMIGGETPFLDLPKRETTDVNGEVQAVFLRANYVPNGASALTVTQYTDTFIKVYKYAYLPFAVTQPIDVEIFPNIVLLDDPYQVETTVATARTLGDTTNTVAIESQTNPAVLLKWTAGTGTLSVGDTIDTTANAWQGTCVEIIEGDSTAGSGIFDSTNATAFSDVAQTIDDSPSAGDWSATYTTGSHTIYDWLIDADTLTAQELYDYMNAKADEHPLDNATPTFFHSVVLWGRGNQGLPIQGVGTGPNTFKTVRNNSTDQEGWAIYNLSGGLGAIEFYTDNAGNTFVPAATVTLSVTVQDTTQTVIASARVRIEDSSGTLITEGSTNGSGVYSDSFTYTGDLAVLLVVRKSSTGSTRYIQAAIPGTITAGGFTQTVTLREDTIASA